MVGSSRSGISLVVLAIAFALSFSSLAIAARGINFESLRAQGMALRDEIRSIRCWHDQAELDALQDRYDLWWKHVVVLEKTDPEIKNAGGGWRANRLSAIWDDLMHALSDLRYNRPCPSSGTPRDDPKPAHLKR